MKYTVLYSGTLADLEEQVNAKLPEGWRPAGGLATFVMTTRSGYGDMCTENWFAQALKQGGRAK